LDAATGVATMNDWTDVNDSLPCDEAIVLIVYKNRFISFGERWESHPSGWYLDGNGLKGFISDNDGVTHWQRMPALPEREAR
jgi:hypothetical protein